MQAVLFYVRQHTNRLVPVFCCKCKVVQYVKFTPGRRHKSETASRLDQCHDDDDDDYHDVEEEK